MEIAASAAPVPVHAIWSCDFHKLLDSLARKPDAQHARDALPKLSMNFEHCALALFPSTNHKFPRTHPRRRLHVGADHHRRSLSQVCAQDYSAEISRLDRGCSRQGRRWRQIAQSRCLGSSLSPALGCLKPTAWSLNTLSIPSSPR